MVLKKRASMTYFVIKESVPAYEGILHPYIIPPEWSDEEYVRRWTAMSQRERECWYLDEFRNTIVIDGLSAINAFLGSQGNSANVPGFAQYFEVGTGSLGGVDVSDDHVIGPVFRKIPLLVQIVGNVTIVSTKFNAGEANYAYTNSGLYGGASASATLSSGTLMTHVPYNYEKSSSIVLGNDYSLIRQ
jgi:hypothetical protein